MSYLYSAENVQLLTIGCLNLLAGTAVVDFPTSTRSHPSFFVTVSLSSGYPLRDGDRRYFPFQVPWHLWQRVIVPVLHPETLETDFGVSFKDNFRETLRNWKNAAYLGLDDYGPWTDQISLVLATLMEAYGYLPPGTVETTGTLVAEESAAPGEPVVRGPVVGDPNYPQQDSTLIWAEGNLRLTYPIV